MYKWGAAAAYCCARLLVARANRTVIVFALFLSVFFVPTLFSGCGRVRFFRSSISSHHHESYKTQARAVIHFAQCASYLNTFRSIHSCTCPAHKKNYTSQQKHTPALRFQRRLSAPSFRFAPFRAISVSHPRSTRWRLAPLTTASKQSTPLRFATLLLAFVRLKAALPALFFPHRPHTAPDHPPLKVEWQFYNSPIGLNYRCIAVSFDE